MSIETMKKALEYLQENEGTIADVSSSAYVKEYYEFMERFADVIKQAEKQEPVAWMYVNEDGECEQIEYGPVFDDPGVTPLYTAPPKQWVGLTAPEVQECYDLNPARFASRIEAKLKEKNT